MYFSPGADASITTVPGKGCFYLLLSLFRPVTPQFAASLLLLKVIHAGEQAAFVAVCDSLWELGRHKLGGNKCTVALALL